GNDVHSSAGEWLLGGDRCGGPEVRLPRRQPKLHFVSARPGLPPETARRPFRHCLEVVTADDKRNYRVELPPSDYILDVLGECPNVFVPDRDCSRGVGQTVRFDMNIDTGIR